MHSASDHGYAPMPTPCIACGKTDVYCCDGNGNRLDFEEWAMAVDSEICRIEGTHVNDIEAPYAEMYHQGLTVAQGVNKVL